MEALCEACSRGPSGIDGHAALMAQTVGNARVLFKCQRCESLWSRTVVRGEDFVWAGITERMALGPGLGMPVPPRSKPF